MDRNSEWEKKAEIESTLNYIKNYRIRTDGRLTPTHTHTGRICFQQMQLTVHSVWLPYICWTFARAHTHTHTHTVLVYTLLRQPQHNYRSRLIIRISLPLSALTVSLLLSLPLPLQLLTKFLYTHLPSLTTQLNFHPFLTTWNPLSISHTAFLKY